MNMIFVASELLDWAKDEVGTIAGPFNFQKENASSYKVLCLLFLPQPHLEHPARRITGLIEACFPSTWEVLLWVPPVPVCGCCLGGFLSLGNGLRMGNSGFYGYWASWDLQLVFQR